jgi:hypothetical protein
MEQYLYYGMRSSDSEELFWGYKIVKFDPGISLDGIVEIYELAEAGCIDDILESIRRVGQADMRLWRACIGGQKKLALLIIKKYHCDPNWGLYGACSRGHKELALLMIERIESSGGSADFNQGLIDACYNEQKEMIQLMIEKGATKCGCHKHLDEH